MSEKLRFIICALSGMIVSVAIRRTAAMARQNKPVTGAVNIEHGLAGLHGTPAVMPSLSAKGHDDMRGAGGGGRAEGRAEKRDDSRAAP